MYNFGASKLNKILKVKRYFKHFIILIILIVTLGNAPYVANDRLIKIVLDAGHGGKDPGCVGLKSQEKDVALDLVLKVGNYIEKSFQNVKVYYTRRDDRFVELYQRAKIANDIKADIFISIHCNASKATDAYGTETFVMGINKIQANLDVARKENAVILKEENYEKKYDGFDPNSPEANIIFALYQNAFLDQSLNLATKIQQQFHNIGRFDRGVKQAGFLVLYKTAMTGILIEAGFLSNPEEEKFLNSQNGQNQIAYSIFKAFREYKYELEGKKLLANNSKDIIDINKDDVLIEPPKKDAITNIELKDKKDSIKKDSISKNINLIKDNPPNKQDLIFKIQIAVSREKKALNKGEFTKIKEPDCFEENGIFKYTSGNYFNLEEAKREQEILKQSGYKDAFVIAFFKGKKITMNEALEILKNNK